MVFALRDNDDDSGTVKKTGRIYNKILANVLKSLKVTDDARQQELALAILRACPELVAGYVVSWLLENECLIFS